MQGLDEWVNKLSAEQRRWVCEYLQKRRSFPLRNQTDLHQPAYIDPDNIQELINQITILREWSPDGEGQFRKMDDALRKKVWRGRDGGVERTVILKKDLDKNLARLMQYWNLDRSKTVARCIQEAVFRRKQEWDDLDAKRSRLTKLKKKLEEREEEIEEREKELEEREDQLKQRDEANRDARMAEDERARANNALDLLVRGLSKAPDDATVEFQFGEDGSLSAIKCREGNSQTEVWSEQARRELEQALECYISREACSTQEDGARGQSQG